MPAKFGTMGWLKEATDQEYADLIKYLLKEVSSARKKGMNLQWGHISDEVGSNLSSALRLLEEVDLSSAYTRWQVSRILFHRFEDIMRRCAYYARSGDTALKANSSNTFAIRGQALSIKNKSQKIVATANKNPDISSYSLYSNFAPRQRELSAAPNIGDKTHIASVDALIADIQKLSQQTKTLSLNSEEKYFVEQIFKEYVPHVVNAAAQLTNVTRVKRSQAEKQFVEQLSLVQAKLVTILKEHTTVTMNAVTSQTDFLRKALDQSKKGLTV